MNKLTKRIIFIAGLFIVLGFALFDALDLMEEKKYQIIPHGSHNHYVPFDRDPNAPIGDFPTEAPRDDQRIMPDGKVVTVGEN